jgi:hypothetical protein
MEDLARSQAELQLFLLKPLRRKFDFYHLLCIFDFLFSPL